MIELSLSAWMIFGGFFLLSNIAGLIISFTLPWARNYRKARYSVALGCGIAPFLLGMSTVLALHLLPRHSYNSHLLSISTILAAVIIIFGWIQYKNTQSFPPLNRKKIAQAGCYLLAFILLLWVIATLINTLFIPLLQNDALEYATVGRELFHARTLDAYPAMHPESNFSGFFGPWTHPPLYVSLIYLTSIIQGHANEPGLMRLIAPWFFIATTYIVVVLGSTQSKRMGIIAGILFVSTPLLFLGADSSLIDALPVAGMAIILLIITGLESKTFIYSLCIGFALGFALWTHSEAILFIPISILLVWLNIGLKNRKSLFISTLMILAVAGAIAWAPYAKNWLLFNSPISDNPLVFALPILDWAGYFRVARGLDNWVAIIQYGIFKGWFSLEAYGAIFWLWTIGLIIFFRSQRQFRPYSAVQNGFSTHAAQTQCFLLACVLVLIYLLGVVASVTLGIDLMIRNERYMLVIVPAVAIGASYCVEMAIARARKLLFSSSPTPAIHWDIIAVSSWLILTALALQLFIVGWHYRWRYVIPPPTVETFPDEPKIEAPSLKQRFEHILNGWPSMRAIQYLKKHVGANELILSMRPADMYYSDKRMVSYLDERLVPIYLEKTPEIAAKMLKDIGIEYIHVVDYSLPPLYNSVLQSILADPKLTTLEYASGMFQIFSLKESGLTTDTQHSLLPGATPWTRTLRLQIGGRKALDVFGLTAEKLTQRTSSSTLKLFTRDYSVMLQTGWGTRNVSTRVPTYLATDGEEFLVRSKIHGRGFIRFWLTQLDDKARPISIENAIESPSTRIGELALTEKRPEIEFMRRIKPHPDAKYLRFGLEHVGASNVTIDDFSIITLKEAR